VQKGDPVVLKKLINRDWKTGEPVSVYDLDDYEERWGYAYNMFHRQYMHKMLMECALQEEGTGTPVKLLVNYPVKFIATQQQHYWPSRITLLTTLCSAKA
jgi:salicylate hydroxylase